VPFEVRPGPAALGVETAGAGVGAAGRGVGPMAWKSVRWFEKVFWDCRILRTPGVVPLPWLAVWESRLAYVSGLEGEASDSKWYKEEHTSPGIVSMPYRHRY